MKEKKTEVITVRVTSALKKMLEKSAREGCRTLSREIDMRVARSFSKKTQ